jgi:two-component system response regulator HydG
MENRLKILIVDDEESLRMTFAIFLSKEGYHVMTTCTYEEALAALERNQFDLLFVDVVLGGKSGFDLLREIRGRSMSCPVVMITGSPSDESAARASELGAFDYIPKPVLKDTLLQVTRAALGKK